MRTCKTIGCGQIIPTQSVEDYCLKHLPVNDAHIPDEAVLTPKSKQAVHAIDFLINAGSHMDDRAQEYDSQEGERSMAKTVAMFNILCDTQITETQGWKFMECLKLVRSEQGEYKADNYEDGAAYMALAGESHAKEQECIG